jgi:hypothetical protein
MTEPRRGLDNTLHGGRVESREGDMGRPARLPQAYNAGRLNGTLIRYAGVGAPSGGVRDREKFWRETGWKESDGYARVAKRGAGPTKGKT